MWKCKHCGGTEFEIETKINNEILMVKKTLNINDIKRSVRCCNCYNWGVDMHDVAFWEEEDERD